MLAMPLAGPVPRLVSVQVTLTVCPGRTIAGANVGSGSFSTRSGPVTALLTVVSPVLAAWAEVLAATTFTSDVGGSSSEGVNTRKVTVAVSSGDRKKLAFSGSGFSGSGFSGSGFSGSGFSGSGFSGSGFTGSGVRGLKFSMLTMTWFCDL